MKPPDEEIRLRLAELEPDDGIRGFGVLSDDELNRARRFLDPRYGEMFMARRALVRYVVGDWLGLAPEDVAFGQESRGKPYVIGHGDAHFSVSHAGPYTMVAMGSQPVGVDIETLDAIVDVEGVAGRVLSVREGNVLSRIGKNHQPAAVLAAWARKEAAAKADGGGLAIDLATIETTPGVTAVGTPCLAGTSRLHVWDVEAPTGHAAAVASTASSCEIDFAHIETAEIEGARLSTAG